MSDERKKEVWACFQNPGREETRTRATVEERGLPVAMAPIARVAAGSHRHLEGSFRHSDVGPALPLFAWPEADQEWRKFSMMRPMTGRDPPWVEGCQEL